MKRIDRFAKFPIPQDFEKVVAPLGTGGQVSAQDTVPFCLWCVAHNRDSYEGALWMNAAGGGDYDTTCAIVGGIMVLAVGEVPTDWARRREGQQADFTI